MTEIALALRWDFPWMTYHPWILKGIVCEVSWMELNDPENSLKLLHSESQNRWVSEVYGNYLTSGMPWEVSEFSLVRILCCSSPGSSVHGILQARILEWVAIPFSRWSSWPRDRTLVSCVTDRFFTTWATREAPEFYKQDFFLRVLAGFSEICGVTGEQNERRKKSWKGTPQARFSQWLTLNESFLKKERMIRSRRAGNEKAGNEEREKGWHLLWINAGLIQHWDCHNQLPFNS